MPVKITGLIPDSPAFKKKITPGDILISVNGNEIHDVLDYRFHIMSERLILILENGRKIKLKKEEQEDPGLLFDTYLMDNQQRCKNKCVFCFIDQLPSGMRDALYFKDDDSRLSFLQGNYITLTNITEREINRILKMHISPVNISVHTTNTELRAKMMGNPRAGDALKCLERFAEGGISMNCQLVLCPGINDGDELRRSLTDLGRLYPNIASVAAVPVGLTKFREGLSGLSPFDRESARAVLNIIEEFAAENYKKHGEYLFHAADEFYLKADLPLPDAERYDDFAQYENGVGISASLLSEFSEALETAPRNIINQKITIATGVAAVPVLNNIIDNARKKWHNLDCEVVGIKNDFFGGMIDVAGLVTGQDLIAQLKGRKLGEILLLPSVMLRAEGDLMLDGTTPRDIENALSIPVKTVKTNGAALLAALTDPSNPKGLL